MEARWSQKRCARRIGASIVANTAGVSQGREAVRQRDDKCVVMLLAVAGVAGCSRGGDGDAGAGAAETHAHTPYSLPRHCRLLYENAPQWPLHTDTHSAGAAPTSAADLVPSHIVHHMSAVVSRPKRRLSHASHSIASSYCSYQPSRMKRHRELRFNTAPPLTVHPTPQSTARHRNFIDCFLFS